MSTSTQSVFSDAARKNGGSAETGRQGKLAMLQVAEKPGKANLLTKVGSDFVMASPDKKAAEWLEDHIAKSQNAVTTQIVDLTPALARVLLNRNNGNRKISDNVTGYCRFINGARVLSNVDEIGGNGGHGLLLQLRQKTARDFETLSRIVATPCVPRLEDQFSLVVATQPAALVDEAIADVEDGVLRREVGALDEGIEERVGVLPARPLPKRPMDEAEHAPAADSIGPFAMADKDRRDDVRFVWVAAVGFDKGQDGAFRRAFRAGNSKLTVGRE